MSENNALILPNYDLTVHIVPIVACSCRLSFGVVKGSIIDSEIDITNTVIPLILCTYKTHDNSTAS